MDTPQTATPDIIAGFIKEMGPAHFWPNRGNYGDLLIAEGIRDFFARHHISYNEFSPDSPPESYNLVYGGGGIFIPEWIHAIDTALITGPRVGKCLILPCSIRGVDGFVRSLDKRHTVLCRDRESYNYCRSLNNTARFFLTDDMALQLDITSILEGREGPEAGPAGAPDQAAAQDALSGGLAASVLKTVRRATIPTSIAGEKKRIAFILRTDSEAVSNGPDPTVFTDISLLYNSLGYAHKYNKKILRAMADALAGADAIVSNRLHVCIMAHLLGKEVYMLDNSYGKLRGVYEQSLSHCPHVHYVGGGGLPPELRRAYAKLHPWLGCLGCWINAKVRQVKSRAGAVLRKLHLK